MKSFFKSHPKLIKTAAIVLVLLGFLCMGYSIHQSRSFYYAEYDKHITDVLEMVDHSVAEVLERCHSEMEISLMRKTMLTAEQDFLSCEDPALLQKTLTEKILMNEALFCRILVLRDGQILFSSDKNDSHSYTMLSLENSSDLSMCQDESGQNYLCICGAIPDGALQYAALITLDDFYVSTVAEHVYETYWTVLYDAGNDLFLQNEWDAPVFTFLTPQEAKDRQDGYSIIVTYNENTANGIETYSYTNRFGERSESRIAVLNSTASENREFAIGVALASGVLFDRIQLNITVMLAGSLVALFGIALGLHIIVTSARERKTVESRLETLEAESKAYARLLEQQKELSHHQRMEMIGTLTAGIAHEFNNLLTPIMGYSMMVLDALQDTDAQYDNVLEIYQASVKAKKLIQRISRLSGKNADDTMQTLSFAALVQTSLDMAMPAKPNRVETELHLDGSARIFGNAPRLEQMLLNLFINAFYAMQKNGGVLTVSATVQNGQILCTVSDTGVGIRNEIQDRIFDPFFTTKEPGKGTGLGLSTVAQVVMEHHGSVHVESVAGNTVFTLTFPCAAESEA